MTVPDAEITYGTCTAPSNGAALLALKLVLPYI